MTLKTIPRKNICQISLSMTQAEKLFFIQYCQNLIYGTTEAEMQHIFMSIFLQFDVGLHVSYLVDTPDLHHNYFMCT